MTVAEIIAKLQEFPPHLPVVVNSKKNEMGNGQDAREVELLDQVRWGSGPWATDYFPHLDKEPEEKVRVAVDIGS